MDLEMAKPRRRSFQKQGLEFQLGARVERAVVEGEHCVVKCEGEEPIQCDRVLLAIGRVPNTDRLGLDTVGIEATNVARSLSPIRSRPTPKGSTLSAIAYAARNWPIRRHTKPSPAWKDRERKRTRQLRHDSRRGLHAPRNGHGGQNRGTAEEAATSTARACSHSRPAVELVRWVHGRTGQGSGGRTDGPYFGRPYLGPGPAT